MSFEMLPYYLFNSETCAGMKKIINQTNSKIKPRASTRCLGQSVAPSGFSHCEVLFLLFQAAASTCSPLPGPDVEDAWPPSGIILG